VPDSGQHSFLLILLGTILLIGAGVGVRYARFGRER
jgi:hypothetical protein